MSKSAYIVTTEVVVKVYTVVYAESLEQARDIAFKRKLNFGDESSSQRDWNPRKQRQPLDSITRDELVCALLKI